MRGDQFVNFNRTGLFINFDIGYLSAKAESG